MPVITKPDRLTRRQTAQEQVSLLANRSFEASKLIPSRCAKRDIGGNSIAQSRFTNFAIVRSCLKSFFQDYISISKPRPCWRDWFRFSSCCRWSGRVRRKTSAILRASIFRSCIWCSRKASNLACRLLRSFICAWNKSSRCDRSRRYA